jgi:hypothetical protein
MGLPYTRGKSAEQHLNLLDGLHSVLGLRRSLITPDSHGERLSNESLEGQFIRPIVAKVERSYRGSKLPTGLLQDPEGAGPLVPARGGQNLDDLGAMEDLEPGPVLQDRPG